MQDVTLYVFPTQTLQVQKHYMQCHMRKSPYMKMKEYMAQGEELNNYLLMFPDYNIGDEVHEDELVSIY